MNLLLPATILLLGGLVKGLNGFGYAVVSTTLLTTVMPAQQAVATMIIPLILANIQLLSQATVQEIKACIQRFAPYLITSIAGVLAGTLLIDTIPQKLLAKTIGLLTLLFVASKIDPISDLFHTGLEFCAENPKIEPLLGLLSGTVFGTSNIGVPFIAYFQQIGLEKKKFATMIALTVLLTSAIRIPLSAYLGMYSGPQNIIISALLAIPGLAGVYTGEKLSEKLPDRHIYRASLLLMTVIGFKLLGTF
ncbi:TSUP family transporter [Candidatus Nanohaloarchaea archaeon]|nr:TSUP family transporter [Candidatus Nanohaloarchaea archaeon]